MGQESFIGKDLLIQNGGIIIQNGGKRITILIVQKWGLSIIGVGFNNFMSNNGVQFGNKMSIIGVKYPKIGYLLSNIGVQFPKVGFNVQMGWIVPYRG